MKAIILLLAFLFLGTSVQSENLNNSQQNYELIKNSRFEIVQHKIWHLRSGSQKRQFEISLYDSQSGLESTYDCSQEIMDKSDDILDERPNGSEVFVIIFGGTVFDLDICHEHDGAVIECGDPL